MSVRKCLLLALSLAVVLLVRPVSAQSEARIHVVSNGVEQLKEDLKYLVTLSPNPALKKQWADNLEPLLDSFAVGIDPSKPIRVDVIVGKDVDYELHFPIQDLADKKKGFIPNVEGFGFKVKLVPNTKNLYTLTPTGGGGKSKGAAAAAPKKPMYMRYLNDYASIAATQEAIPANMPNPITAVQPLLNQKYDIIGSLKNGADDLDARKKNFQELRRQLEAGVTFKRNEDKNEFALRKLTMTNNLNEAERFVVQTEELMFGWRTTIGEGGKSGNGHADFHISALPKTDLFKSTEVLAAKPSYFANVQLSEKPQASGKINFGLDDLRADHLKEFYKTVKPLLDTQIDKRASLTDAKQKDAAKKAGGILLDLLVDSVELKVADVFMDLRSAGDGKHTFICGVRAADGKKVDQIIKLLPDVNVGREVSMDIKEIGNASLHSVTVPERRQKAFNKLFPGEKLIYVATSKDAVWGAAGVDAVAALETAIKQAAEPAPEKVDPRVVYFTASAARLIELMDIVRPEAQKADPSMSKEEQQRIKTRDKDIQRVRNLADAAMGKCDAMFNGEIKKEGDKVVGYMDVSECVLTFIGSVIADFAKDIQ